HAVRVRLGRGGRAGAAPPPARTAAGLSSSLGSAGADLGDCVLLWPDVRAAGDHLAAVRGLAAGGLGDLLLLWAQAERVPLGSCGAGRERDPLTVDRSPFTVADLRMHCGRPAGDVRAWRASKRVCGIC